MRLSARTFAKESSPREKAPRTSGSSASRRAMRTCSRAVRGVKPGEPLRGRAGDHVASAVDLRHQLEPAAGARVQVRGERRQLVLEFREGELGHLAGLTLDDGHVFKIANASDGAQSAKASKVDAATLPYSPGRSSKNTPLGQ